jgi:DNA polymerase I
MPQASAPGHEWQRRIHPNDRARCTLNVKYMRKRRLHLSATDPTDTGRFSSSEPNMQNITRGELRTAFVASVGNVLVIADYSQIELRVAAYFSGDKRMIEAFIKGEDLHTKTASLVLGKSEKEITNEDRQLAKALNFGLLYGQSAERLVRYAKTRYGVEMTEKQAAKTRAIFFKHYDGLARWHAKAWDEVECAEVVEGRTILGRRRLINPEASNWDCFQAKTDLRHRKNVSVS